MLFESNGKEKYCFSLDRFSSAFFLGNTLWLFRLRQQCIRAVVTTKIYFKFQSFETVDSLGSAVFWMESNCHIPLSLVQGKKIMLNREQELDDLLTVSLTFK